MSQAHHVLVIDAVLVLRHVISGPCQVSVQLGPVRFELVLELGVLLVHLQQLVG